MAISDHMPKDPAWCMKMAELEGDYEIGAGIYPPEVILRAYAEDNGIPFPDKDD